MSCTRTQEFLATHDIQTVEQVDAKKNRYGADEVLPLLDGIKTLIVAKGKKAVRLDLQSDRPEDAELAALMLGPSGNLRAPTLRVGQTMLIGFHPDSLSTILLD
ncbi:MAG: hypothetical protein KDA85_00270 [Planctomycetaceae bacterium]|nr:hypothetical protein [Planctomycetaceae bacterium]